MAACPCAAAVSVAALVLLLVAAGCSAPPNEMSPPHPEAALPAPEVSPPGPPPIPSAPVQALSPQAPPSLSPAAVSTGTPPGSEKMPFFFPWPKGEKRYLTTNFHEEGGLDFASFADPDAAILAAANGTVIWAEYAHPDSFNTYPEGKGDLLDMGNSVILQHAPDTFTIYLHLRHEETPPVSPGQVVQAGTRIGRQGDTGKSHGAHLHFAVVNLAFTPLPLATARPRGSWGFMELNGSNTLTLNAPYESWNLAV
jgi:murein DD-endopeptidase MepM/ murein hydrolase activator NlpD